jgi:hypothetical protein
MLALYSRANPAAWTSAGEARWPSPSETTDLIGTSRNGGMMRRSEPYVKAWSQSSPS